MWSGGSFQVYSGEGALKLVTSGRGSRSVEEFSRNFGRTQSLRSFPGGGEKPVFRGRLETEGYKIFPIKILNAKKKN